MLIYYCTTIAANIIAAFVFRKSMNISALSLLPLCLMALMAFQAMIFKNQKAENGFQTAYNSNLTADEENRMMQSGSRFLLATVPWMIPFVIFFPSVVKILSILVYLVGLIGSLIWFRWKHKDKIAKRMSSEENERKEQEKKEQLGKWK